MTVRSGGAAGRPTGRPTGGGTWPGHGSPGLYRIVMLTTVQPREVSVCFGSQSKQNVSLCLSLQHICIHSSTLALLTSSDLMMLFYKKLVMTA